MVPSIFQLVAFLREKKSQIIRKQEVRVEWDDSFGSHSSTDTIETIGFEELLQAIDEFAEQFKAKEPEQPDPPQEEPRPKKGKGTRSLMTETKSTRIGQTPYLKMRNGANTKV